MAAAVLQELRFLMLVGDLFSEVTASMNIVQMHGMQALRENPELMGTSVGMLRRAAATLLCIAKIPPCQKYFFRQNLRLLHFTMSSLMDSPVAATIADVLFELQPDHNEDYLNGKS